MAVKASEIMKAFVALIECLDARYTAQFVAKDGAKVLSTNDFTDALKAKLDGIIDEEISVDDIKNLFKSGGGSAVTP